MYLKGKDKNNLVVWLYYSVFLFGFFLGGGLIRIGMELLNEKHFEYFLLVILSTTLAPIFIYFVSKK